MAAMLNSRDVEDGCCGWISVGEFLGVHRLLSEEAA